MDLAEEQLLLEKSEPISTSWFDLPFEMREMVIDRMDSKTRCRFAQCSRLCEEEAKNSKRYLYGINTNDSYMLQLLYNEKTGAGYTLHFIDDENGETSVVYETSCFTDGNRKGQFVKWTITESGVPSEVRSRCFKEYTERYKNSIKFLHVSGYDVSLVDHHVRNLKYLKEIKVLNIFVDLINCGFLSKKQIMNAEIIDAKETNFTFEEIIRFEGSSYDIWSEEFDEDCILKYLKMWKNGELSRNLKSFSVYFHSDNVDLEKIVENLDVFNFERVGECCEFEFYANHHVKDQLVTSVDYTPYYLCVILRGSS